MEDPQAGLRMASALWLFWGGTYSNMEGMRWLRNCLDLPENAARTSLRGYALARLSYILYDIPGAEAAAQESLEIFSSLKDRLGQGIAQLYLGRSILVHENIPAGREHITAAREILEEICDPWWLAEAQALLAMLAQYQGDITAQLAYIEKALALQREIGDQEKIAWLLHGMGVCTALYQGDLRGGYARMLEAQAIFRQNDLDIPNAYALQRLAEILCWQGEFGRASQAWEEMRSKARLSEYDGSVPKFDLYRGRYICLQGRLEEGTAMMGQAVKRIKESASINYLLAIQQTFQMELAYAHACLGEIEQAENLVGEFGHFFKDAQYQPRFKRLLGFLAYRKGEAQSSAVYFWESLRDAIQMEWRLDALQSLEGYAWALHLNAKPLEAARLLGAAAEFRARIGAQVFPRDRPFYDQVITALKDCLGEAAFSAAWAAGQAIDFDLVCSQAVKTADLFG